MKTEAVSSLTLSVQQAARLLGVGRGTLYHAIRNGRVPVLRVGRRPNVRVPRIALERLVEDPTLWEKGWPVG